MARLPRLELQALFEQFTPNVYYQPPRNITLKYPCIIYQRQPTMGTHANNLMYMASLPYQITVIDRDPESIIADRLLSSFRYCNETARFTNDNLYHVVLTMYNN